MCGICGVVDGRSCPDPEMVRKMLNFLVHRGPDDEGIESLGQAVLGFRRLAILDLTPTGHQPMYSADGRYCIVFNGEVYNYVELRQELEARGHIFRSNTDTEVLLQLYAVRGIDMLQSLNGMFAFAIYDTVERKVVLARDRMGKKPLFYWVDRDCLAFASELKALRQLPNFPRNINTEALALYLRLGYVPNWICIHPGVRKLSPGHWLEWCPAKPSVPKEVSYWHLPEPTYDETLHEADWLERIQELLWDAVRIRLRSDAPLALFLSSGIDSGLIAVAARQAKQTPRTITVSVPGQVEDEWELAQEVAHHLGLPSFRKVVPPSALEDLPRLIAHFDEPFSDSSAVPTSAVCQAGREEAKVALSGDGGDEVFAGYRSHVLAQQFAFCDAVPEWIRRNIAAIVDSVAAPDSRAQRFARRLKHSVGEWGLGQHLYPFEAWVDDCLSESIRHNQRWFIDTASKWYRESASPHPLDTAQRMDMRLYLLDDVLVKVDRMSMLHSLEVRCPMLDYRLVELALRIPPRLRIRHNTNKWLLRQLARRYLPQASTTAPKLGFGIPMRAWLMNTDKMAENKQIVMASPVFRHGGGLEFWRRYLTNPGLTSAFFRILAFELWREGTGSLLYL